MVHIASGCTHDAEFRLIHRDSQFPSLTVVLVRPAAHLDSKPLAALHLPKIDLKIRVVFDVWVLLVQRQLAVEVWVARRHQVHRKRAAGCPG